VRTAPTFGRVLLERGLAVLTGIVDLRSEIRLLAGLDNRTLAIGADPFWSEITVPQGWPSRLEATRGGGGHHLLACAAGQPYAERSFEFGEPTLAAGPRQIPRICGVGADVVLAQGYRQANTSQLVRGLQVRTVNQ
jgi:hypothetical protein